MVGEGNDDEDCRRDQQQLRTCVVLGGRGFIGRSLVLRLLKLGKWIIRVADSAESLELDPYEHDSLLSHALSDGRASFFHVDVRNKPQIIEAIEGSSAVFYTDDIDLLTNDFYLCYTMIVGGVKNVINACRECKIKRLVYNSSADVVSDSSHDIHNVDESLPYAGRMENMLSDLKAHAEALVLVTNDIDGLLTCVIRPTIVFGPGDKHFVPRMVKIAQSSWAKFIIGSGENMSDFIYVENVAHAHICAEEALCSRMVSVSGKVFFVTNLEPMKFWEFVSLILDGLAYPRPIIKLPGWMVWYSILLVKWIRSKMGIKRLENFMSVYSIVQLASCTRTFNCSAAQKHLGYSPVVSLDEGVALTVESFSHLKDSAFVRYSDFVEGKVEKLLGSGRVADLLLWRDEKKTFMYFLLLGLFYYWFFLCGRTFISSAAKLLLLSSVTLFAYGNLPSNIFGFEIPRVPLSAFVISEVRMQNFIASVAYMWNRASHVTRLLAQGENWNLFFKVAGFLYILKWIISHALTMAVGLALVLAFTSFFFYEQYEEEIDGMVKVLVDSMWKVAVSLMKNLPMPSLLPNSQILHKKKDFTFEKDRP